MQGRDVERILRGIGATKLYHANSITTSCTFLEQGGLLSRYFVENHNLSQTPQDSDYIDKRYGIWDRIFIDHVDIHYRAGPRKGPNQYGPVLFVFDLNLLLELPTGSEVGVTKMNPVNWVDNQSYNERWFESVDELRGNISFGDFTKMLVIQAPAEKIAFPNNQAEIFLDDPRRRVSSGEDAYVCAENRLRTAARSGNIAVSIVRHECHRACSCIEKYARYGGRGIDLLFT
jgi:hypothetical protein